ncbi:MAG: hypothetical protein KI791_09990 [Cyclobacteriaceae bacterium]|nr:hypothetical protein [Cyclobacteriaceae bacterium SS2]
MPASTYPPLSQTDLSSMLEIVQNQDKSGLLELLNEKDLVLRFDWMKWSEGSDFEKQQNWDFSKKDEKFCLKLLTSLVRNDHFIDGFLDKHFRSGLLEKLIRRLMDLKEGSSVKTISSGTLASDLNSALDEYKYQPELTKKLDKFDGEFDENVINEIALWKVNRYYRIPEELLFQLNQLQGFMPGEHGNSRELLHKILEIQGIDIAMASTLFRFRNPEVFQIIDKRAFRVVYGEPLKLYTGTPNEKKINTYFKYLDELINISEKHDLSFSTIDRTLYQLDITLNKSIPI